ncbi:hypothetical protein [Acanthopleuribacter pedis]|uniref:hypothetical protein n=1 Tax=Acanthopleuribacter pedis TaxID=442870 RepID=UPI001FAF7350|nr:hypothetical protein [Acanthopleuribacter pedis]
MPQCDFFMEEADFKDIASFFLSQRCEIVPSMHYSKPEFKKLTCIHEVIDFRHSWECTLFFVIRRDWIKMPLNLIKIEKESEIVYFISQRDGGPSIHIFSPFEFQKSGENLLPHGFIGLHKDYWDYEREILVDIPEQIKAVYKSAIKNARKSSRLIRSRNRKYYVCKNADKRLGQNLLLGAPFDKHKDINTADRTLSSSTINDGKSKNHSSQKGTPENLNR